MNNERRPDALKTLFVIVGVVVSIGALAAVAYALFKKYFKISFDCDCGCDDCNDCNCCCFDDEDAEVEPICCCEDEPVIEE